MDLDMFPYPITIAIFITAIIGLATLAFKPNVKMRSWNSICTRTKEARDAKEHQSLSQPENDIWSDEKIASMSATQLREAMHNGDLACESVTLCFIRRSRNLGLRMVNAVTAELYDEAWEISKKLDESGALLSTSLDDANFPLLGLPISIKDSMEQAGSPATCGLACRAENIISTDGLLVTLLKTAGAIPFVRTNVPQLLMMSETENRIFGRTINPWNPMRTPGGSSGGEAALVSLRGSPLGIASDVGGSIRIPSSFCGSVGFKPTPERITTKGMANIRSEKGKIGQRIIRVVAGPIANSVDDCELLMRAINMPEASLKDPYVPPIAWNSAIVKKGLNKPLRVGLMVSDGWFRPCSAVERGLQIAANALKEAGHTVVPFEYPVSASGWEVCRLFYGEMGSQGNMIEYVQALKGEKFISTYKRLKFISDIPSLIRPILSWVLGALNQRRHALLLKVTRSGGLNTRQYMSLVADHYELREAYVTAVLEQNIDVILMPGTALPALPHGASSDLTPMLSYMYLANLLHWPAGILPVSFVKEDEQFYHSNSDLPVDQRCMLSKKARIAMVETNGLPVGVQVIAPPWKDELCMHAMREIERGICKGKNGKSMFIPPLANL